MLLNQLFLEATSQLIAFEDNDDDDAAAKAAAEAAAKAAAAAAEEKKFTQEDLNKFLAEDRRKNQDKQRKILTEMEQLKQSSSLTAKEKSALETRIDELQSQYLTVEEKARRTEEAAEKKRLQEVEVLTGERDDWRPKDARLAINTEIIKAAAEHKAIHHEQIIALIGPKTKLVQKLDEEGKPTEDYEPKVDFEDKDKEEKPIILQLTVPEAIKRMKELEQFGNLFEGDKKSGLGGTGNEKSGSGVDLVEIAKKDPAAYRKLRTERDRTS